MRSRARVPGEGLVVRRAPMRRSSLTSPAARLWPPLARIGAFAIAGLVAAATAAAQPAPRPPAAGARPAPARAGKPAKVDVAKSSAALQGGDLAAAKDAA